MNVAFTVLAAVIRTVQDALRPRHSPDHPDSTVPGTGAAVSVTCVPWAWFAVQLPVQDVATP